MLTDEMLFKTILEWMDRPSLMEPNANARELMDMIREAERGKGDATVNGCAECAKNLYHVFSHPKPTPYADKVLEVAIPLMAEMMNRGWNEDEARNCADHCCMVASILITAANDAAIQNTMKREGGS